MKPISGKKLAKLLEKYGWSLARINCSHHIYVKVGRTERISLPIHSNQDLKIGLIKHILKIAEIPENDL